MTDTSGRRERYAVALYNTLETSPFHTPWEELGPLRRTVWYARAEAAMAVANAEHAVVEPPADRAALRDRIRRAVCEAEGFMWNTELLEPDEYGEVADAVLAVLPEPADRATVLREEADRIDATRADFPIAVQNGITWATAELRRHATECPQCGTTGACNGGPCPLRRMADETATTETLAAALSPAERTMLDYALNQAQLRMWSVGGYTAEEQAALVSLRRLTADEPAAGARQDGAQS